MTQSTQHDLYFYNESDPQFLVDMFAGALAVGTGDRRSSVFSGEQEFLTQVYAKIRENPERTRKYCERFLAKYANYPELCLRMKTLVEQLTAKKEPICAKSEN